MIASTLESKLNRNSEIMNKKGIHTGKITGESVLWYHVHFFSNLPAFLEFCWRIVCLRQDDIGPIS